MLRALAVAGALLLGLAPMAVEAATVTGIVNIRTGPGTKYPIVRWAWPGVEFTVDSCSRLWCKISYFGVDGYVSAQWVSGYTAPVVGRPSRAARTAGPAPSAGTGGGGY